MTDRPILMRWNGDGFTPANRYWAKEADKHFVIGEQYALIEHHARSSKTHAHYFAVINEAWQNLPEDIASDYPTAEHLRKKALIACGYADERSIVCASKAEAVRVAAFIRPMDDFAVVLTSGIVVKVFTAKSQSLRAMGATEFAASKTAVLEWLAGLLSVTPKELKAQGEAA